VDIVLDGTSYASPTQIHLPRVDTDFTGLLSAHPHLSTAAVAAAAAAVKDSIDAEDVVPLRGPARPLRVFQITGAVRHVHAGRC
jgi:hypothetical protein